MSGPRRRAVTALGAIAIAIGIAAVLNGLSAPTFAMFGPSLLRFMAVNTFGGLFAIVVGIGAIVAARSRRRGLLLICGAAFVAAAAFDVVAIGRSFNVFGGTASIAGVYLGLGTGLLAIALTPELEPEAGEHP